jgi:hypothetical protein
MFLDIIHHSVSYLEHNISETVYCLRHQTKAYFYLMTETESSLRILFLNKTGLWIISRNAINILIYHGHETNSCLLYL